MSNSAIPWTTARQASLSITNFWSLLKLTSVESVMPSNHLILCRPLLLPSIFPSIWVFSNESVLCIRWPKDLSFSFSISPSNEYSGLISYRMDWLDFLVVSAPYQMPNYPVSQNQQRQQQLRGSPTLNSAATSSQDPHQAHDHPTHGTPHNCPAWGVQPVCEKGLGTPRSIGTRCAHLRRIPATWARLLAGLGACGGTGHSPSEDRQARNLKESALGDGHREVGDAVGTPRSPGLAQCVPSLDDSGLTQAQPPPPPATLHWSRSTREGEPRSSSQRQTQRCCLTGDSAPGTCPGERKSIHTETRRQRFTEALRGANAGDVLKSVKGWMDRQRQASRARV